MPPRGRPAAAYKCTTIQDCRRILQLTGKDAIYKALRSELANEMVKIGWVNKATSGEQLFNNLCQFCMDHKAIKALKTTWSARASEDSTKIQAALLRLIIDLSQKRNRTAQRHGGALGGADDEVKDTPTSGAPPARTNELQTTSEVWQALGIPYRPAITIHIIDPERVTGTPSDIYRHYDWYGSGSLIPFINILQGLSMQDLERLAIKRAPPAAPGSPARAFQAFYGALSNSAPQGQAAYPPNPEYVQIGDSEELESWLKTTEAKPLRLCAVLHRLSAIITGPTQMPQTPSQEGYQHLTRGDINGIELDVVEEMLTLMNKVDQTCLINLIHKR